MPALVVESLKPLEHHAWRRTPSSNTPGILELLVVALRPTVRSSRLLPFPPSPCQSLPLKRSPALPLVSDGHLRLVWPSPCFWRASAHTSPQCGKPRRLNRPWPIGLAGCGPDALGIVHLISVHIMRQSRRDGRALAACVLSLAARCSRLLRRAKGRKKVAKRPLEVSRRAEGRP